MQLPAQKHVVIVAGPTAVGKTALAIALAEKFHTSIISADSRQCYGELDIGVARPSVEELDRVKHYFIASHSIHDELSAGSFEQYALQAAEEIFHQHYTAVMVGGTGLYIKTFCEGMDTMPTIDPAVRNLVTSSYKEKGLLWLQTEVQVKDPVFWQTAEQQNPQRLMRALEVVYGTGQSITAYRNKHKIQRPFRITKIGLELPRELLYDRINKRVDMMMEAGLLDEARAVYPFRNLNALQTVGYKELFDHFDGHCTLPEAVKQIKQNTRHYAKRQMTWFKKDAAIKWVDARETDKMILEFNAEG